MHAAVSSYKSLELIPPSVNKLTNFLWHTNVFLTITLIIEMLTPVEKE